jgi:hypothetical protein
MARNVGDETPAARKAYLDYEAMGDKRSIRNLLDTYRTRSANGEDVPTTRHETIGKWSSEWDWQARIKQHDEAEAERVREEERKRNKAFRSRVRAGIEFDVSKYLKKLDAEGGPILAEDAASLERLTKLFLALGEDPVTEKVINEHTGANGGPVQVQTIPLPVFGPQDPLNHFGEEAPSDDEAEDDDDG